MDLLAANGMTHIAIMSKRQGGGPTLAADKKVVAK